MRIAHVALWTADLDAAARFWSEHFNATVGSLYRSARRPGFISRFVTLAGATSIELMSGSWIAADRGSATERVGWAHVAIGVGTRTAVDALAAKLQFAGYLVSPARTTGDGYYEALARTPDGSLIEIVADVHG